MEEHYVFNIDEVCDICLLDKGTVEELVEMEIVHCEYAGNQAWFSQHELEILLRVKRLMTDLDINLPGVEIIIHMRQKMLKLQEELEELHFRIRQIEV